MQRLHHRNQDNPARAWFDAGGHKNPPSAPPAIPPLTINPIVIDPAIHPLNRHIPIPAIDPRTPPPGPPIVPPRGPGWRI
jgi:hypothetical protein